MLDYLKEHRLLPPVRSAYRKGHSTGTALLKVTSDVWDAMDKGMVTLLGLLDLSAAFDTIDHDILINRLRISYGLSDGKLKCMESLVRGRNQTVTFNS